MCTRFYTRPTGELAPIIREALDSPLAKRIREKLSRPFTLLGEIRPTDVAAVLAPDKNGRPAVFPMIWGFSADGLSAPIVNARIETAAVKPMFRDSWSCRRCIIPASNYFEWEHYTTPNGKSKAGDKFAIKPKGSDMTYLAGLYRFEMRQGLRLPVFTVLTKEPTEQLRRIHDRMPLMLPESAVDQWIRQDSDPADTARLAVCEVVLEKADNQN